MAFADSAGLPVADWIASASPHDVTLVEETLDQMLVEQSPERLIGDEAHDSDDSMLASTKNGAWR